MKAIYGFFSSTPVYPEEFVPIDEQKLEGYTSQLGRKCFCLEKVKPKDYENQTIAKTSCCSSYFHKACLAKCTSCPHCYKALSDNGEWDNFLKVVHETVLVKLGFKDEEFVQELVAQEEEQQNAIEAQIRADLALAIRLQNQ